MTFHIFKKILSGQSLARILMNLSFRDISLRGVVLDVGGARNPDYFSYFNTKEMTGSEVVDGSISHIDFEKDALPKPDGSVDTVLLCNVLEHIYNHRFILGEIHRVLKSGGQFVGFVPFLVNYHPDPQDYFRYTKDALKRLLTDAGFTDVHVITVGGGPFFVNFNTIMLSLPTFLRPLVFIPYLILDKIFIAARPHACERYPLGYTFFAKH